LNHSSYTYPKLRKHLLFFHCLSICIVHWAALKFGSVYSRSSEVVAYCMFIFRHSVEVNPVQAAYIPCVRELTVQKTYLHLLSLPSPLFLHPSSTRSSVGIMHIFLLLCLFFPSSHSYLPPILRNFSMQSYPSLFPYPNSSTRFRFIFILLHQGGAR